MYGTSKSFDFCMITLLLMFALLVAQKLDGQQPGTWYAMLVPLWIVLAVLIAYMPVISRSSRQGLPRSSLIMLEAVLLFVTIFTILLAMKVEGRALIEGVKEGNKRAREQGLDVLPLPTEMYNWYGVFAPLWIAIILALGIPPTGEWPQFSHRYHETYYERGDRLAKVLPMNFAMGLLAFTIMLALKLDDLVDIAWSWIFLPLWYIHLVNLLILTSACQASISTTESYDRTTLNFAVCMFPWAVMQLLLYIQLTTSNSSTTSTTTTNTTTSGANVTNITIADTDTTTSTSTTGGAFTWQFILLPVLVELAVFALLACRAMCRGK